MLNDEQVEQYLKWAEELNITYQIDIKENVVCEDWYEAKLFAKYRIWNIKRY